MDKEKVKATEKCDPEKEGKPNRREGQEQKWSVRKETEKLSRGRDSLVVIWRENIPVHNHSELTSPVHTTAPRIHGVHGVGEWV